MNEQKNGRKFAFESDLQQEVGEKDGLGNSMTDLRLCNGGYRVKSCRVHTRAYRPTFCTNDTKIYQEN